MSSDIDDAISLITAARASIKSAFQPPAPQQAAPPQGQPGQPPPQAGPPPGDPSQMQGPPPGAGGPPPEMPPQDPNAQAGPIPGADPNAGGAPPPQGDPSQQPGQPQQAPDVVSGLQQLAQAMDKLMTAHEAQSAQLSQLQQDFHAQSKEMAVLKHVTGEHGKMVGEHQKALYAPAPYQEGVTA